MGEEHTMLYYRPSLQEEGYNRHNPTIFYPLTRGLQQHPGHLDPGHQSLSSRAQVYNQTNANFSQEILSERKNANQRVQGLSSPIVGANPGWMQQQEASGRNFRSGKPFKTAPPTPPPSLEDKQPEPSLVQMCSGFGHQECLLGQDNFADFDMIEKGLVSSEEEVSGKSDDLLSTPPMWRKSKDWQKETRGQVEAVRIRLKLDSWKEKKATKKADMEKTEESRNEQLMEERMEEGVEETIEEMNVEIGAATQQ